MNKDSKAKTAPAVGAPDLTKIEITPAMIEAGAKALYEGLPGSFPWPGAVDRELVAMVFSAMIQQFQAPTLHKDRTYKSST